MMTMLRSRSRLIVKGGVGSRVGQCRRTQKWRGGLRGESTTTTTVATASIAATTKNTPYQPAHSFLREAATTSRRISQRSLLTTPDGRLVNPASSLSPPKAVINSRPSQKLSSYGARAATSHNDQRFASHDWRRALDAGSDAGSNAGSNASLNANFGFVSTSGAATATGTGTLSAGAGASNHAPPDAYRTANRTTMDRKAIHQELRRGPLLRDDPYEFKNRTSHALRLIDATAEFTHMRTHVPSAVAVNNASDYSRASDLARRGPRLEHKQHSTFGVRVPRIEPREPREGTYRHGIQGVGGAPDPNPNQANSAHTTAQRQRLHLTSASILNSLTPVATT